MNGDLAITTEWERLDEGAPEERASFAKLGIRWNEIWLTEGRDNFVDVLRTGPYVSAYDLAQWMVWNWWRLRWEPRSTAEDWAFAHRMTTIGQGYVWPDITIFSDGERVALIAKPTTPSPSTPFRYINEVFAVATASEFEVVTDEFIERVRGKLRAEAVSETNLDRLWADVTNERRDPETAKRRKLEALLGFDPDEADTALIERLVKEALDLGQSAVEELAAESLRGGDPPSAQALQSLAVRSGFAASQRDTVRLEAKTPLPKRASIPAWRLGAEAANALRAQEKLDGHPIANGRLAAMAGVQVEALTHAGAAGRLSYTLDDNATSGRVVLRSKWETSRRFDLARLLGDRLVGLGGAGRLFPATHAFTYRQKMQRSFAAELLCPFETVDDMLDGDYSEERQEEVADHFDVSEMTIRTLLANHRRIDREELEGEFESAAA